jgi:putative oxidoreductase
MKKLLFSTKSISFDFSLLILRVASGAMIMTHGWPKLSTYASRAESFRDPLGLGSSALSLQLAIFAEFFCAILLILGLFTRLATIPLMITMAVVALIVHAEDGWGRQELPLMYLASFMAIFFAGPGKLSLDSKLGK